MGLEPITLLPQNNVLPIKLSSKWQGEDSNLPLLFLRIMSPIHYLVPASSPA